jgi:hypothetical protein
LSASEDDDIAARLAHLEQRTDRLVNMVVLAFPLGAAIVVNYMVTPYSTWLAAIATSITAVLAFFGPAWYGARGERLAAAVFDAWLPVKDAAPTWCDVLGLTRTASRAEIVAAYRDKAKLAHPDVGGSHEAMTALSRARDAALLTLETWSGRARR